MFQRILVANRGVIARRIIRTLRRMGVSPIAVYSDADRHAPHVADSDAAVRLGPSMPLESYLNQQAILEAARQTGAEAIHPGYGFLSENPDFAEACENAGIVFLGPTAEQMRPLGMKHVARQIAVDVGVPLLPGSSLLKDEAQACSEAERCGYPIILKTTAGGGGIGMRVCRTPAELTEHFAAVSRLGASNFGQADVYLERYIERVRHIEVQIFGDGEGGVVALGERDCSVQRRHQKVIEEAPAPGLSADIRSGLMEAASTLVRARHYRSAGTIEFLFDDSRKQFFFLEVNARLQVEHGVTEEVTGIDIVEWMIRLGAGDLPPLTALKFASKGASIEARVYPEDPTHGFRPSAGLLTQVRFPANVRCETWVENGIEVTPHYDAMLAKIIVTADTREEAVDRLAQALADTRLAGLETNLDYLRCVVSMPEFRVGGFPTSFLNSVDYHPRAFEVIDPGMQTTVQDYPGRTGFWHVGVPPSGPVDSLAFRLANRLVNNPESAAGLECTIVGPALRFHSDAVVALAGADMGATLNGQPAPY